MKKELFDFLMRSDGTEEERALRLELLEQESAMGKLENDELTREMNDPTHPKFKTHWPLLARAYKL